MSKPEPFIFRDRLKASYRKLHPLTLMAVWVILALYCAAGSAHNLPSAATEMQRARASVPRQRFFLCLCPHEVCPLRCAHGWRRQSVHYIDSQLGRRFCPRARLATFRSCCCKYLATHFLWPFVLSHVRLVTHSVDHFPYRVGVPSINPIFKADTERMAGS